MIDEDNTEYLEELFQSFCDSYDKCPGYVPCEECKKRVIKGIEIGLSKGIEENKKLNKKIRRYEEIIGTIFAAGNMIMQEKSKYEELRTM